VLGVLEVTRKPADQPYTAEDETILTSFADQAVLAIERTRLNEEVTRVAVLEQSNDLKSALLAAVSHDLRTPLTAIKTASSALLSPAITWEETARSELLRTIDEETDRLTLMVANLLDLSRIEGGALRPDRDWQDLADVIHDALQRTGRQTAGRTVEVRIETDLPVVYLDYVEIVQVMINLIGNAVKYSAPGTPVTIAAMRRDEAVRVSVTDHGRGIAPEYLDRLFDPFFRVGSGGPVSGSGIGLAICKGLIEAHGGAIQVSSHLGVGTTVMFDLPIDGSRNGVKTA
jgi:two-component system sensor histidine kinase KdpD